MATLNESQSGKAVKGRTKKATPKVDLTAMVDLMFLLTTFFMLTTTLSQLNAADIAKPDKTDINITENYPESRTMTIVLGKDNKVVSYMGTIEKANMKVIPMASLQKEIASNKLLVAATHQNSPSKYMIVIIKPGKTAKFQNFVDAVDEMKIADIKSYSIDDDHFAGKELSFMKMNGI
ncbi:biopolymer transporter ExbD [Pedobacter sp. MR2016-19]|uniref:biopolymer transporter ExbD n=1 Tax=Pedobacter sp. MR2016-19 TaxID=2780089 RepID=UPI0018761269|nr:biopolymer transporter ExbD [Pedobacter sp. MR2016-19]MBE5320529.1 biopolymer transporter ExbD [Pedobacter sp. MR2016-19]